MKKIKYIIALTLLAFIAPSCKKVIDLEPISNTGTEDFYKNYTETNVALTGCYNGLHEPLYNEWMFTELRGDNSYQGSTGSSAVANTELDELDMFTLNPSHDKVYDYWLSTYKNIRAINYVLKSIGVNYQGGNITITDGTAQMNAQQKNEIAGEALFLRAYHYFNLVRLYGGVFVITEPVDPKTAKQRDRNTVEECYQLITADLLKAKELLPSKTFSQLNISNLGRANIWAVKSLLAKVYLTLDRKADALPLLNDVIDNSGYDLLSSYEDVFSINNEMNKEIIFAVRYKGGGLGLGSPFANLFAPTGSGNAVVNNDGNGYNDPTESIKMVYKTPFTGPSDVRKNVNIGQYSPTVSYVKKFTSQVINRYDAENDFPIIRFSDVLLMKAEAVGFDGADGTSVSIINKIRERAGAADYPGTGNFNSVFYKYPATGANAIDETTFNDALFNERRLEFAFENQRYFDILRSGDALETIRANFAQEYDSHYSKYRPVVTLEDLQDYVTEGRLLLPIPQREIDTNDQIKISQNTGYF